MFSNYPTYIENYNKYLREPYISFNTYEYGEGFSSTATLCAHIYGQAPQNRYVARFSKKEERFVLIAQVQDDIEKIKNLDCTEDFDGQDTKIYSFYDTLKSIGNYVVFRGEAYVFTDYGIIMLNRYLDRGLGIYLITSMQVLLFNDKDVQIFEDFINNKSVEAVRPQKESSIYLCTVEQNGIETTNLDVKPFDCDLEKNYNDDLPYDELSKLIKSDNQELILLHGEPGTGKTSIIKKLVNDNPSLEFLYFDYNLLSSLSNSKVVDFLSDHKNSVFIIEDCEKLFTERNSGNPFLNVMLNLTDGIIGECFKIKFICTFNCPTSKIDKAVMRKGRLSLIYEFKRLSLEKTRRHLPNATMPMTLAQIYHEEDNGHKELETVGFN